MLKFWLFAHIFSVMLAFGPTYAFPLMSAGAQKDPKSAPTISKIMDAISNKLTWPFAILTGITGVAIILTADIDFFETRWLILGVVLYLIGVLFSALVQTPNMKKMVAVQVKMAEMGPPPAGTAAGPPPQMAALGKKLQMGGMFLGILVLLLVLVMVYKPTF